MTTLWDTTAGDVVQTLAQERRTAGAVTTGIVLTLVAVVDERNTRAAMEAAAAGAAAHPCRLLVVIRRQPDLDESRLDAEVTVGGQHGAGESVVLRVYGRLAHHAESVVLPLLAPDTPVVTWWHGKPPARIADDPLGALASRRITDAAAAADAVEALRQRAREYSPGDTDLAWSRLTPWRALLASAFDTAPGAPLSARVFAEGGNPSAHLLGAWLGARLGIAGRVEDSGGPGITAVELDFDDGVLRIDRPDGRNATIERPGSQPRIVPLMRRSIGDLLGEELRRLDADEPYADALQAFLRGDAALAAAEAARTDRPGEEAPADGAPADGAPADGAPTDGAQSGRVPAANQSRPAPGASA